MFLGPQDHERLNALSETARQARLALAAAAKQHRANKTAVSLLKGAALSAQREYTTAYRAAGLHRQSEWQRVRVSQGLCRLCGSQAVPGEKHCQKHLEELKQSGAAAQKKRKEK